MQSKRQKAASKNKKTENRTGFKNSRKTSWPVCQEHTQVQDTTHSNIIHNITYVQHPVFTWVINMRQFFKAAYTEASLAR